MTIDKCFVVLATFAGMGWAQVRTTDVNVPANRPWTRTGIYLNPGSTVLLEARGSIEAVSQSDTRAAFHRVPPEGRPERQINKPQPLLPALGLLARIGNGPVLEAGARAEFPVGDPYGAGELQLGINDDNVDDNSGSWTVRVTVRGDVGNSAQPAGGLGRFRTGAGGSRQRDRDNASSIIDQKAQEFGGSNGFLGPIVSDTKTTADGVGRYREYRNGSVYWSPNTGAHEVHGAIREKWMSMGAERGDLGYPVSDEQAARDGRNRVVEFERGSILWNERDGAQVLMGNSPQRAR
ncbi:MAG: hypothetical protein M3Z32_10995 [Acidobacteriota bacterium]|nr:hypothetical protein [Acidobacteriota bacterium]